MTDHREHSDEATTLADHEAERRLIAAVLADNRIMERLSTKAEDFFDAAHVEMWKATRAIIHRGEMASVAVLSAALPNLKSYIARLPDCGARPEAAATYAATVRNFAMRRRLVELADDLRERAGDTARSVEEIVADATGTLSKMPVGREAKSKRRVAEEIYDELDRPVQVYSTGIAALDETMGGGLFSGYLYGFGARKKVGKTVLLGTISHNLNCAGINHLYVCLEMSDTQIEQRAIARHMNFNSIQFKIRTLHDLKSRVGEYVATIPNHMLYEHRPGATFDDLRGIVARARLQGIRGILLDYLQLVGGRGKNETEAAHHGAVAQWLADMARTHDLFAVTAAQLNQDDGVRGGEGLKLAADQYYVIHREVERPETWLEMQESRYTLYQNVGSDTSAGLWLRKYGPHFSVEPPRFNEWPVPGAAA